MMQNGTPSSGLTFEPGSRNTLTFMLPGGYRLHDIELLDKDGSLYHPVDAAQMEVVSESVKGGNSELE